MKLPPHTVTFEVEGPLYINACEHKEEDYLFSINVLEKNADGKFFEQDYDVYCFTQPSGHVELCARYGNEGREYLSTDLECLVGRCPGRTVWGEILKAMKSIGEFQFVRVHKPYLWNIKTDEPDASEE